MPAHLWNQAAAALGTPADCIPDKQVLTFVTSQYFLVLLFGGFVQLAYWYLNVKVGRKETIIVISTAVVFS